MSDETTLEDVGLYTSLVLMASTMVALAVLHPALRKTCWRVLQAGGCAIGLLLVLSGLIPLGLVEAPPTPLHAALERDLGRARNAPALQLQQLLAAGADANAPRTIGLVEPTGFGTVFSEPPLYTAASQGDAQGVAALLKAGADPNGRQLFGPMGLISASTPLWAAARGGYAPVVAALLEAGADPGMPLHIGPLGWISREPPLWNAAHRGSTAVVDSLLGARVDPNVGMTCLPRGWLMSIAPLSSAARNGHTKTVRALIAAGADPRRRTTFGPLRLHTPSEAARSRGHGLLAGFLDSHERKML